MLEDEEQSTSWESVRTSPSQDQLPPSNSRRITAQTSAQMISVDEEFVELEVSEGEFDDMAAQGESVEVIGIDSKL